MNYRICRISRTAYDPVFEGLYASDSELRHQSFDEQSRQFFDRFLVYPDSFSREMTALGNESIELLYNAEHIQKAWAAENGVKYGENWMRDIAFAQIERLKPEIVYFQGIGQDSLLFLGSGGLRETFPFIKLIIGYCGFLESMSVFDDVDVVICGAPSIVAEYHSRGLDTQLVYHGFDDAVLDHLKGSDGTVDGDDKAYTFTFSGYSGLGAASNSTYCDNYADRYWDLVRLMLETGLEAWIFDRLGTLETAAWSEFAKKLAAGMRQSLETSSAGDIVKLARTQLKAAAQQDAPMIPHAMLFPELCHPAVFGIDMFRLLSQSKLTFNRHTNALSRIGRKAFGNIRAFEATGVGACLVTDFEREGRTLFEPDSEIVTYASIDECVEKVQYLLDHEDERAAIAQAGQRRTLENHTVRHRCEEIHDIICRALLEAPHRVSYERGSARPAAAIPA